MSVLVVIFALALLAAFAWALYDQGDDIASQRQHLRRSQHER